MNLLEQLNKIRDIVDASSSEDKKELLALLDAEIAEVKPAFEPKKPSLEEEVFKWLDFLSENKEKPTSNLNDVLKDLKNFISDYKKATYKKNDKITKEQWQQEHDAMLYDLNYQFKILDTYNRSQLLNKA